MDWMQRQHIINAVSQECRDQALPWHIFNAVMVFMSCGLWAPIWAIYALACAAERRTRITTALAYYGQ